MSFSNIAMEHFFFGGRENVIVRDLKMQRVSMRRRGINRCDVYTAFKTRKECLCPDLGHSSLQGSGTQAC